MGGLRACDIVCRGVCRLAFVRHLGGVPAQSVERMNTWLTTKIQDPRSREDPRSKIPIGAGCPVSGLASAVQPRNGSQAGRGRWSLNLGSSLDLGCWRLELRCL